MFNGKDNMDSDTGAADGSDRGANNPDSSGDGDGDEKSRINAWSAGGAGVFVAVGFAVADAFWPALAVLLGALVASGLLLLLGRGKKRYVLAGVVYCLGLAIALELLGSGVVETAYVRVVLPAVAGLGAISASLVLIKVGGKRAIRAIAAGLPVDREYLAQIWETLAAFGSLLALAWLLLTFTEKVVRYTSVSVGAVALLVANMLGYQRFVTILGMEFEAVMVLFVGCVLLWFHVLDTLHNSWRTVAMSAEKAGSAAGSAASRVTDDDSTPGSRG